MVHYQAIAHLNQEQLWHVAGCIHCQQVLKRVQGVFKAVEAGKKLGRPKVVK